MSKSFAKSDRLKNPKREEEKRADRREVKQLLREEEYEVFDEFEEIEVEKEAGGHYEKKRDAFKRVNKRVIED